jgi:hypothetical protein
MSARLAERRPAGNSQVSTRSLPFRLSGSLGQWGDGPRRVDLQPGYRASLTGTYRSRRETQEPAGSATVSGAYTVSGEPTRVHEVINEGEEVVISVGTNTPLSVGSHPGVRRGDNRTRMRERVRFRSVGCPEPDRHALVSEYDLPVSPLPVVVESAVVVAETIPDTPFRMSGLFRQGIRAGRYRRRTCSARTQTGDTAAPTRGRRRRACRSTAMWRCFRLLQSRTGITRTMRSWPEIGAVGCGWRPRFWL